MLCLCIDFGAGQKNSGQPTTLGQARKVYVVEQQPFVDLPQSRAWERRASGILLWFSVF